MKKIVYVLISMLVLAIFVAGCTQINEPSDLRNSGLTNNQVNETKENKEGMTPPNEAIEACKGKSIGQECQFESKDGTLCGECDDRSGVFGCAPYKVGDTNKTPEEKSVANQNNNDRTNPPPKEQQLSSTPSQKQPKSTDSGNEAPKNDNQSGYSIEQAISDKAQLNTLAFDGLGFLTGNLCSDSFLPPGKVADFFGFQYLRDKTQAGKGHSTDFVTNCANNVLYILNDGQKSQMIALAKTQASLVNEYAYKRYPLMTAFRRQLEGDMPSDSSGLSKEAIMDYTSDLYEIDAEISIQRAELFADIINSLNDEQTKYLDNMVKGGFASWPALSDQVDKKSLSHDEHVLVMTYASEMFGWYAGDIEADTYFCPERQGDYFGGFYIKDAPAIGNAGYTINEAITGDSGEAFIATLDTVQKPIITNIVDTQRPAINGIVEKRRAISTELRKALTLGSIDEDKVMALAREYGALDGEISYYYATAFAKVGATLTNEQKEKLMNIRNLDNYPCEDGKIYLYSEKINRPTIQNTDFLFK
ncbi:MAG: hypothetical protein AMQ22_00991 [Candidatus Methanofastidiosum methylothiophilum]|uniref:Uncharacterized protein n=1 Tax=Candidatus Methanofastidiosum methylothiophilum TaxID=1705564 RepID=A0A150J4B4_9EURY|nr:MAG: hypothetical protein AMQ22_00991 [Candidatus Methanofastidiosum methylthiophilus]